MSLATFHIAREMLTFSWYILVPYYMAFDWHFSEEVDTNSLSWKNNRYHLVIDIFNFLHIIYYLFISNGIWEKEYRGFKVISKRHIHLKRSLVIAFHLRQNHYLKVPFG